MLKKIKFVGLFLDYQKKTKFVATNREKNNYYEKKFNVC